MSFQITTVYPDGTSETRDATDDEIAQRDADIKAAAALARAQAAEAKAKAAARNAVLEKLGLTAEEVDALLA